MSFPFPVHHLSPSLANPKEDYRDWDDNEPFHELVELIVKSLDDASRAGVPLVSGGRLHPIPIGNKGDWPYLATGFQVVHIFSHHVQNQRVDSIQKHAFQA